MRKGRMLWATWCFVSFIIFITDSSLSFWCWKHRAEHSLLYTRLKSPSTPRCVAGHKDWQTKEWSPRRPSPTITVGLGLLTAGELGWTVSRQSAQLNGPRTPSCCRRPKHCSMTWTQISISKPTGIFNHLTLSILKLSSIYAAIEECIPDWPAWSRV